MFDRKFASHPEIASVEDATDLVKRLGPAAAGEILKDQAAKGSLVCQQILSQSALHFKDKSPAFARDAEIYTKMAAESGDPAAQYNLAKLYFHQADMSRGYLDHEGQELVKLAKHWSKKSADQGFDEGVRFSERLKVFDF